MSTEMKVDRLIDAIERLKRDCNIPASISEGGHGFSDEEYRSKVSEMALSAFDDQCTGCNPRFPLVKELEELFLDVYGGVQRRREARER